MMPFVRPGFYEPAPRRDPPRPQRLRVLWRMQGPRKVCAAALYEHPRGRELRVYLEPEDADDVLHSQVERFDFAPLEEKAEQLRDTLREKGWWALAIE